VLLSITEFIGRFHPVLVHLPIGILFTAVIFQWLSAKEKSGISPLAIKLIVLLGMISAFVACLTGYMLSLSGEYNQDLVDLHMWMGIGVLVVSIVYFIRLSGWLKKIRSVYLSVILFVLIGLTGHFGGSLTHGEEYLTEAFNVEPDSIAQKPIANIQEAKVYHDIIQPILQKDCYSCHGAQKQKGKLRMDEPGSLMKGGEDGEVIVAGSPKESEMIQRMLLPKNDEDHMPPKNKRQPSEAQIAIIHWWINEGADFEKKVKELKPDEKVRPYLIALQKGNEEKKEPPILPEDAVEKGDEKAMQKLKDKGAIIHPVSQNSNYLMANFITATEITDKDMLLLLPLKKQLISIKLGSANIGDKAMESIGQCRNLVVLHLDNTKVSDTGLAHLNGLVRLRYLNLVGTNVTADGIKKLNTLKELKAIYLYQTNIDKSTWPQLKKSFPKTLLDSGGYIVPLLVSDTLKR
jgi:uncharacterized membrane protein/mono/diheme cytochrome c family protein